MLPKLGICTVETLYRRESPSGITRDTHRIPTGYLPAAHRSGSQPLGSLLACATLSPRSPPRIAKEDVRAFLAISLVCAHAMCGTDKAAVGRVVPTRRGQQPACDKRSRLAPCRSPRSGALGESRPALCAKRQATPGRYTLFTNGLPASDNSFGVLGFIRRDSWLARYSSG